MNQPFEASITKATNNHRQELTRLLQTAKLPAADLPASLDNFFVVTDKGNLVAAVGLEFYADCGLLRSMVVAEAYRNNHIASQLLLQSEAFAKTSGIDCLYLFTETAAVFFESKGFQKITRAEVPKALQASSEFSHVCPVSATVMKKPLL